MSIISPELFSRSLRVRSLANKLALRLKLDNLWQVDVAALLAQIGSVTIPSEITKKKWQGEPLSADEQQLFIKHLEAGKTLVENIPRLEKVAEAILYQEKEYDGGGFPRESRKGTEIPLIARILKIVHDYEILMTAGKSPHEAISDMFYRTHCYDAEFLAALKAEVLAAEEAFVIREISVRSLRTGMVLADNLRTKTNLLLVAKRQEISDTLRLCILGFAEKGNIVEPIKVIEWQGKTPEVQKVSQKSEADSDSCASIIDAVGSA